VDGHSAIGRLHSPIEKEASVSPLDEFRREPVEPGIRCSVLEARECGVQLATNESAAAILLGDRRAHFLLESGIERRQILA